MALKKKNYVGVDIGHHSIKVAQVEKTSAGYKVAKTATFATPVDSIKDGIIMEPKVVGFAIKAALKEAHIGAHEAIIAAAGGAVFVRTVPFPKLSPAMLRDSVKFEAARYLPGSVEDSFCEAEIVGPLNEAEMNVLLVAAPKDAVNSRLEACFHAGLHVDVVELEPFAMYRSMVETDPSRDYTDRAIALVDIGAATTKVAVVSSGVYSMQRTLPYGGNSLTDALVGTFGLETADAEAGKTVLDLSDLLGNGASENPPLRVIQPHLDDLIREIRRSLTYFQSQSQNDPNAKPVEMVILSGGGAQMKGVAQYFTAKLGITCEAGGVFSNPVISHSGVREDAGLDLTVAAGLGMRAYAKAA